MSKRVFIIHGWGGYPEEGWFPWLQKELMDDGFTVTVPAMPDTSHPRKEAWLASLTEAIGKADEQTYLVGHSLGAQVILLYLQSLPVDIRIGGAVFVAPVAGEESLTNRLNEAEGARYVLGPWIGTPIDWISVREHARSFSAIFSDNDRWIRPETQKLFQEKLGATTVMLHNMSHFSGDDGVIELPEALDAILRMSE